MLGAFGATEVQQSPRGSRLGLDRGRTRKGSTFSRAASRNHDDWGFSPEGTNHVQEHQDDLAGRDIPTAHISSLSPQTTAFDLVITNGHIIDGTGSPWYSGDLGIRDGKIAAIGNLSAAPRMRTIDAASSYLSGFIDILCQSETTILVDPRLPSKIYQGITSRNYRRRQSFGRERERCEQQEYSDRQGHLDVLAHGLYPPG